MSQAQSRRLREAQRSRARACRGRCWLRACVRRSPVRHREPRQPEGDVAIGPAPSVLWLVHDDLRTWHGRHACRPLASGYSTARVERLLPDLPVARVPCRSRKRRARPRGSTVPRRPYGALGQRGPLGPAPLRSGPLAARGDEQAGLRGRPLIVASWTQGSWEGATAARAHDQDAHALQAYRPCRAVGGFICSGSGQLSRTRVLVTTIRGSGQNHSPWDRPGQRTARVASDEPKHAVGWSIRLSPAQALN